MSFKSELNARRAEVIDMVEENPYRLWVKGREEMGPILVGEPVGIDPKTDDMMFNAVFLPTGEVVLVLQFDLGRPLNAMQVIALSAR